MKRAFLAVLLALAWTLPVHAAKKKSTHEQIAKYAVAIGANRLVDDVHDKRGQLLLRFALVLTPGNEIALGAGALLAWGEQPEPIETKVTEEKLYSVIASTAEHLRQKGWPENPEVGQLCLLYYRMVERVRPNDDKVRLGLRELRAKGIDGDLEQALARTRSLKDIFGRRKQTELLAVDEARQAEARREAAILRFKARKKEADQGRLRRETARKAARAATRDRVIRTWNGTGLKTTRPFTTAGPWEVQWDAKEVFYLWVFEADGTPLAWVAGQQHAGKGASFQARAGTYCLDMRSCGAWSVKVVEVGKR